MSEPLQRPHRPPEPTHRRLLIRTGQQQPQRDIPVLLDISCHEHRAAAAVGQQPLDAESLERLPEEHVGNHSCLGPLHRWTTSLHGAGLADIRPPDLQSRLAEGDLVPRLQRLPTDRHAVDPRSCRAAVLPRSLTTVPARPTSIWQCVRDTEGSASEHVDRGLRPRVTICRADSLRRRPVSAPATTTSWSDDMPEPI